VTTGGPRGKLQWLRALIDDLDAVVWEGDARSGRFTFVSEASMDILGYPPERFLEDASFWIDHVHPEDREAAVKQFVSAIDEARAHDIEYRFLKPDGSQVWVRDIGHSIPVVDGGPIVVRGLIVDVTDYKLAEERRQTWQLERALEAEREESAELRALDETKNTFLAAVSHDLRTPLAAILGLAVTLHAQPFDAEQTEDLARRIAANARKLDRIVSDLLDLDRLSRGIVAPELGSVDLGAVVAGVVGESEIVVGRDLSLQTEDVLVWADASMVERIVENLLVNAVRHTPPASPIWVRVRPDADGALIVVEDEGPGVPPEQRQEVFQPFRQVGAPEHAPGVGIGLALVAWFADLQDGRAWVEDGEHGGASFRVWLPSQPPTPAEH
jgi:PAS domain S-box-containing protein